MRVWPLDPTAGRITSAFAMVIEAIDAFVEQAVAPVCVEREKNPSKLEHVFVGLLYRAFGASRTVSALKSSAHYQAIVGTERLLIEIQLDMELLHRRVFPDGLERFRCFIEVQRLKAAIRVAEFYDKRPALDNDGSKSVHHRAFIDRNKVRIDAERAALFKDKAGKAVTPDHWSQKAVPDRASLLDAKAEEFVLQGYDMRNFAVHTGLAGITGLDNHGYVLMCSLSIKNIADRLIGILTLSNAELGLSKHIPAFDGVIEMFDELHTYALADAVLRERGEEPRLRLHTGHDWSNTATEFHVHPLPWE